MQRSLGVINFYNRFIPRAAELLHPLYECTRGKKPNDTITWTDAMRDSFSRATTVLAEVARLNHPRPDVTLAVSCDASDLGIGAALEQLEGDQWQPLVFFRR